MVAPLGAFFMTDLGKYDMEQFYPIIIWCVLSLVPLIPVYVGFKVLDSSATFHNVARGTKLGGAIAAYFVIMTAGAVMYNQLVEPKSNHLLDIKEQIRGHWSCDATIENGEMENVQGEMYVNLLESKDVSMSGTTGYMTWNADIVIMNETRMVIVFQVPIRRISGTSILRFQRDQNDQITQMRGFWGLTGTEGKGSLKCNRSER